MTQIKKNNDIHEFGDEWGHYVDTEKLIYTINNDELMREKYNLNFYNNTNYKSKKYKYNILETIYDEYEYYTHNNQSDIELNNIYDTELNDSMRSNTLIKHKNINIPNIASTICFILFLTTLIMFIC